MFSTTEDYLNLKAAVSAITTCILELVTEKLGQEIYKVTEKSEGLHTIGDHPPFTFECTCTGRDFQAESEKSSIKLLEVTAWYYQRSI